MSELLPISHKTVKYLRITQTDNMQDLGGENHDETLLKGFFSFSLFLK